MNIQTKGYNTNSGLLYTIQGMSQYKNRGLPVNLYDTANFNNKKLEKQSISSEVVLSDKTIKKVQNELEIKEDPSLGPREYRIEPIEKVPMRIEVKVSKENYKSDPSGVETNLNLK